MLWNNPSVHCADVLLLLLKKKKRADWPIARQVEVSQDFQTKREHGKEGGGVASQMQWKQEMNMPLLKKGTTMW